MKITSKKINLNNLEERAKYSYNLQEFEKQFTYPLGEESFYIKHGKENDYFSFFEKLGKPNIMVLEDKKKNKTIGVCAAVLREINNKKYWYLCDFKIEKEYRGQKLYRVLMWKYFLSCYLQSTNAFAINMSEPKNNKLFKHIGKIFKLFNINIETNYLYSFNGNNLSQFDKQFWDSHLIITNNGTKDIIINNESQNLFHIVSKTHHFQNLNKFTPVSIEKIKEQDSIMFLSNQKLNYKFASESKISNINKGKKFLAISSAEI